MGHPDRVLITMPMLPTEFPRHVVKTRIRGVSIVEALVAMAVMAFGLLAVVGVQVTFRINADIAKQRTEATHVAEQEVERLRMFREVAAVGGAVLGWDEVAEELGMAVATPTVTNATYVMNRRIVTPPGSEQKVVMVEVTWTDRLGNAQSVLIGETLAGAAPVLSGLLTVPATRTAASQRSNRHPTIPSRGHDLGGNQGSVFKPAEGGTVAWLFDNTTGVITKTCTVSNASTSSSLVAGDLSTCVVVDGQLLAGIVRFNLRGASQDLADGTSALKPVPGGTRAWVIDNATSRIVRNCSVSAASSTSTLTATDVAAGAACNTVSQAISPFDWVADPSYSLVAADSENPQWPTLPVAASLSLTSTSHPASPICIASSPSSSITSNSQVFVEYFCIIFRNPEKFWIGTLSLASTQYSDDSASASLPFGITANTYRVCRYTQSATDATVNSDHPRIYDKVAGNLINQNFLVTAGPKACPTDVAANPSTGDFVNSNTLRHQP